MLKLKNSNATFWVIFKHCDPEGKSFVESRDLLHTVEEIMEVPIFVIGENFCDQLLRFLKNRRNVDIDRKYGFLPGDYG